MNRQGRGGESAQAPGRHCAIRQEVAQFGRSLDEFPYVVRVLLENVSRQKLWGGDAHAARDDVAALLDWRGSTGHELALNVPRVLLPDSSGLPVLQDLAALRDAAAALGHDPREIDCRIPVDLVVDHSVQVDFWGSPDALGLNMRRELERNEERYRFLKWAQAAFRNLRVHPPGSGILHQLNLERISPVVARGTHAGEEWVYPDFVLGCDSHTPMVNALGVLGWGVGGIDAEAVLLGNAYSFALPEVVGVRLHGSLPAGAYTTDAVLLVVETLRREGVQGAALEFIGPAVGTMPVVQRATLSNMAPEYGATCAFFPVDERTLDYLRMTGRSADHVALVHTACEAMGLFRADPGEVRGYGRIVDVDLSLARPSLAGPRRPEDRLALDQVAGDFRGRLAMSPKAGGFGVPAAPSSAPQPQPVPHGSVVLAAITSCTNTSNPEVMIAAGLAAKAAAERGLKPKPWVKTSLAPGSRVVTEYLRAAGLLEPLAAVGFDVVAYGCTTCSGKSGNLSDELARRIEEDGSVVAAVLSGNRNFEGRIHRLVRANYLASPPLVVIYALAGRVDFDPATEPVAHDADGRPVFASELLPAREDVERLVGAFAGADAYRAVYGAPAPRAADPGWEALTAATGWCYPWDPASSYLMRPPFFESGDRRVGALRELEQRDARVLGLFGDSLTTDHISPGGEIPVESAAGQYLLSLGVRRGEFNTYVARRGNHHVMTRATFANLRTRNLLVGDEEGGVTRHFPDGTRMAIFDAASAYRKEKVPTLVIAGSNYGAGSSRDWAAKGTALLGVRAVLAKSFERIHRSNLIGMGVVPLLFRDGEGWRELGLTGEERFAFEDVERGVATGGPVVVTAEAAARRTTFTLRAAVFTAAERRLLLEGGIQRAVLAQLAAARPAAH